MVTIKDIATAAGVSAGTVDRVLYNRGRVSEETTKKVWKAVNEMQYKPNVVAQGLAVIKKNLTISFLAVESTFNLFFADVTRAAKERAEKLEQYGITVKFYTIVTESDNDSEIGARTVENVSWEEVAECNGVIMPGIQFLGVLKMEKICLEHNIPIIYYNTKGRLENRIAYVGCNYYDAGRLAAGLAGLMGGETARIGILTQFQSLTHSYTQRVAGFVDELSQKYAEASVVFNIEFTDDDISNHKLVEELNVQYPDVDVIYLVNPRNYMICRDINKFYTKKTKIITNDLVGDAIQMVRDGIIAVAITQEPEKQGDYSLRLMFEYLAHGILPDVKNGDIYTNLSIHVAQNS